MQAGPDCPGPRAPYSIFAGHTVGADATILVRPAQGGPQEDLAPAAPCSPCPNAEPPNSARHRLRLSRRRAVPQTVVVRRRLSLTTVSPTRSAVVGIFG